MSCSISPSFGSLASLGLLFVRHAANGDQNLKWFGVPAQGTSSVVYVHLYVCTKGAVLAPDVKRSNDGVGCEEMDQKKPLQ